MKSKKNVQKKQKRRYPSDWELCNDYLQHCPYALKCEYCRNKGYGIRDGVAGEYCKKRYDMNGDHSKCFNCGRGTRCKAKVLE